MRGSDEDTAHRIRLWLNDRADYSERRIVGGGIGFMVDGHLCCGLSARGLTVRTGPAGKSAALRRPYAQPHRVGHRETKAFVLVLPEGYRTDEGLAFWLERALTFVRTLPVA